MVVSRFYFKDRERKNRRSWAVRAVVTSEEKERLEKGAALLGDDTVSRIVGRIDRFVPAGDAGNWKPGEVLYWFWIFEDEMQDIVFSMFFGLSALAAGSSVGEVKAAYLENVAD